MHSKYKIRIRNLTLLLGSSLTVLSTATLSPALPAMQQAFQGVPNVDFLVRLVLTMPALIIAIGAPFSGYLLDRLGRKPVVIAGLLLFGFAGASGFALNSLYGILAARMLVGLAIAGIMSGFTTLIADYFTGKKLDQYMGYQSAIMAFGAVVFLIVGGFLADVGWRYPYLIFLFSYVILFGVLYAVNEPQPREQSAALEIAGDAAPIPLRSIALIYIIAFLSMVLFYSFVVYIPFHLTADFNISGGQVGLALSLQAFSAAVFSLLFQRFKARFSTWTIACFAMLAVGAGGVMIGLSTAFTLVVLGLILTGIGPGLLGPNLNVWLVSIIPAAVRGRAVGGLSSAVFIGQFLSPVISQPISEQIGLADTFVVMGALSLTMAMVFAVAVTVRSASARPAAVGG